MEKAFILILVALFLGWMIVQQRRLRKYEQYCMDMYEIEQMYGRYGYSFKLSAEAAKSLSEAFEKTGIALGHIQKNFSQNVENKK